MLICRISGRDDVENAVECRLAEKLIGQSELLTRHLSEQDYGSEQSGTLEIVVGSSAEEIQILIAWLENDRLPAGLDTYALERLVRLADELAMQRLHTHLTMLLWAVATDFDALLALNERFIRGELPCNPYHGGPLLNETQPLIPKLLEMSSSGLMTIGSQPICLEGSQLEGEAHGWAEWEQRPYVRFVVTSENENCPQPMLLFKALKAVPGIVVCATDVMASEAFAGSDDMVVVSRGRFATTAEGLKDERWDDSTCSLLGTTGHIHQFFRVPAMEAAHPVHFEVAAMNWGEDIDLLQVVLDAAACADSRRQRD